MARIDRIDFSVEGGVLQVKQRGSPDTTFTVRGPNDGYGARRKDGIKRKGFVLANAGRVALQWGLQSHAHTIVRSARFGKPSCVSRVETRGRLGGR